MLPERLDSPHIIEARTQARFLEQLFWEASISINSRWFSRGVPRKEFALASDTILGWSEYGEMNLVNGAIWTVNNKRIGMVLGQRRRTRNGAPTLGLEFGKEDHPSNPQGATLEDLIRITQEVEFVGEFHLDPYLRRIVSDQRTSYHLAAILDGQKFGDSKKSNSYKDKALALEVIKRVVT